MNSFQNLLEMPIVRIGIVIFAAWLAMIIVKRYIDKIIRRVVKSHNHDSEEVEKQREDTLIGILATASAVIIWVVAVVMMLSNIGVNITALVTGAGLFGAAIGFGAQSAIADFLAGIFIIAENQLRVGDVVTLAGKTGVVEQITIRVTKLRDLDGNLHIVPNGKIDTVTNMTFGQSNVNLNIGVSYDADLDKVKKIINEVGKELAEDAEYKDFVTEPISFLRIHSFDDSSVKVKALGEVKAGSQWDVAGEYRSRLKKAFDKNGIEIPFPQRVIHTVKENSPRNSD